MADTYYRPGGPTGAGTQASPYNSMDLGPTGPNQRHFFDGDFFRLDSAGAVFPTNKLASGVTIATWGSGKAKFSGFKTIPAGSWTSIGSNTYWAALTYGGIVARGGVPLKVCHLTAGGHTRASGIASMVMDSYLWDYTAGRIYIRISGALTDSIIQASSTRFGFDMPSGSPITGLVVGGIDVEGVSVHGWNPNVGTPGAILRDMKFRFCGGERNTGAGYYFGNGVEVGIGCDGMRLERVVAEFCYDSGFSPQLYAGTSALLDGVEMVDCKALDCGLAGVEISTQGAGGKIKHANWTRGEIARNGYGASSWADSSNGAGHGIVWWGSGAAGSYVTDCTLDGADVHDNRQNFAVVNRTGAADASRISILNSPVTNTSVQPVGLNVFCESGSAGAVVTIHGSPIQGCAKAINIPSSHTGASAVHLRNSSLLGNTVAFQRDSSGATITARNCLIQGNTTIASGSAGTLTADYNATQGNGAAGTYSAGAHDVALAAPVVFDATGRFMPALDSPIFTLAGEVQSPAFVDKFGHPFSPTWSRNAYAVHATETGALPTTMVAAFVGDSIARGSDAVSGVPEGTYVSFRGRVVARLQALGIAVTVVGIPAYAQLSRNGLTSATAAQGGAVMKISEATGASGTVVGNSIEARITELFGLVPTGLTHIFMDGGTNNANFDSNGLTLGPDWSYIADLIRSKWPSVIVTTIGPPPALWDSPAFLAAGRAACQALDNGMDFLYADPFVIGYDPTAGVHTIDDGHPNVPGSDLLGDCIVDRLVLRYTGTPVLPPPTVTARRGNWFTRTVGSYRGRWDTIPTIVTAALPAGIVGTAYSQQLVASEAGTFTPASMPAGLSMSSTGLVSGNPTAAASPGQVRGTFTNGNGRTATIDIPITITAPAVMPPTITTNTLAAGTVGIAYDQTIAYSYPSGGVVTMTTTGLPAGLTADPNGRVHGTPTAFGSFSLQVTPTGDGTRVGPTTAVTLQINAVMSTATTSPWAPALAGIMGGR